MSRPSVHAASAPTRSPARGGHAIALGRRRPDALEPAVQPLGAAPQDFYIFLHSGRGACLSFPNNEWLTRHYRSEELVVLPEEKS